MPGFARCCAGSFCGCRRAPACTGVLLAFAGALRDLAAASRWIARCLATALRVACVLLSVALLAEVVLAGVFFAAVFLAVLRIAMGRLCGSGSARGIENGEEDRATCSRARPRTGLRSTHPDWTN